ncbi:MAG: hypothetical protein ABWY12_00285, partial [Burkholderiales bacterium]
MKKQLIVRPGTALVLSSVLASSAWAWNDDNWAQQACKGLPSWGELKNALTKAFKNDPATTGGNGGLGFDMWATIVDRDGVVCAVAFTGTNRGDQWPGSRVI